MRSIIRDYLFKDLRDKNKGCPLCEKLEGYYEAEIPAAGEDRFPPEADQLIYPNEDLVSQYASEVLKQCPWCGGFYAYKEWTPEEPDGRMRKSLNSVTFMEAHLLLRESEKNIENFLHQTPGVWKASYDTHQKGFAKALDYLYTRTREIIRQGLEVLRSGNARGLSPYGDEALEGEDEIGVVLKRYLMSRLYLLTPEILKEVIHLLDEQRPHIREDLITGLDLGIYDFRERPEILGFIKKELQKVKNRNPVQKILRSIDDLLNPLPWTEFLILQDNCLPIGEESLKNHLELLEGVKITNFVPELYAEAVIDFDYQGSCFSADNAYGHWSFTVRGSCSDDTLKTLALHLKKLE